MGPPGNTAVVYVLHGDVVARADDRVEKAYEGQAIALSGDGGQVRFEAVAPSHFLLLSGAEIPEQVVAEGPFIMNDALQIQAAALRYRSETMGSLAPLEG